MGEGESSEQPVSSAQPNPSEFNVYPCFMPDQDCVSYVIEWIQYATQFIIVQAYRFSSQEIADALIKAKSNGISITVFIDKDAEKQEGNLIKKLRDRGIDIREDKHKGKAHNKVMIIDNERVITGSYNWTDSEYYHNSDVIIFIKDECVTKKYTDNYIYNSNSSSSSNKRMKLSHNETEPRDKLKPANRIIPNPPKPCSQDFMNDPFFLFSVGRCEMGLDSSDYDASFTNVETKKKEKSANYVEVNVCFPRYCDQDCIYIICSYFRMAEKSIFIQASSFTHEKISSELTEAYKRKIDVKVLVDKCAFNDNGQKLDDLKKEGIKVKRAAVSFRGTAHSKIIIIDDDLVIAGSFNLTNRAQERNLDNVLFMKNIFINAMFKENFDKRWNKGSYE